MIDRKEGHVKDSLRLYISVAVESFANDVAMPKWTIELPSMTPKEVLTGAVGRRNRFELVYFL